MSLRHLKSAFRSQYFARLQPISRFHGNNASTNAMTIEEKTGSQPLYYHLLAAPNPISGFASSFALSFLPKPPISSESRTIIGFLPAEGENPGLADFKQNSKFLDLMHEAIKSALQDSADETIEAEAQQRHEGWLHINDSRNVPALGRVGDPDDIIGSVLVENGKILPETYQPMPTYRTCTADGPPKLTEGLATRLVQVLREESEREEAAATANLAEFE